MSKNIKLLDSSVDKAFIIHTTRVGFYQMKGRGDGYELAEGGYVELRKGWLASLCYGWSMLDRKEAHYLYSCIPKYITKCYKYIY